MGKKSKRRDGPRTRATTAPSELRADAVRYFDPKFVPIALPAALLETEEGRAFVKLLEDGDLVSWDLGRKGTHIASRWITKCGNEDTLVSTGAEDENYHALMNAHLQRLAHWWRGEGGVA